MIATQTATSAPQPRRRVANLFPISPSPLGRKMVNALSSRRRGFYQLTGDNFSHMAAALREATGASAFDIRRLGATRASKPRAGFHAGCEGWRTGLELRLSAHLSLCRGLSCFI